MISGFQLALLLEEAVCATSARCARLCQVALDAFAAGPLAGSTFLAHYLPGQVFILPPLLGFSAGLFLSKKYIFVKSKIMPQVEALAKNN